MFEQAFNNIDADLRNEAGCTTELDYTEQTSWLLFLKYLDGLEQDKSYHDSIPDAVADLGRPDEIGKVFSGFQRYLYVEVA
jgi:hypothetical protein